MKSKVKEAKAVLADEEEEEDEENFDINDQRLYNVYESFYTIGQGTEYEQPESKLNTKSEPFDPGKFRASCKGIERLINNKEQNKISGKIY